MAPSLGRHVLRRAVPAGCWLFAALVVFAFLLSVCEDYFIGRRNRTIQILTILWHPVWCTGTRLLCFDPLFAFHLLTLCSHATEGEIPGTVNLAAAEGDDTAYGQALFPVPAEDPNDP